MAKGKYENLPMQEFEIWAYRTKNLNAWQKEYKHHNGYGVWVPTGKTIVAKSPWEASNKARFIPKNGSEDQRVPSRFRHYRLKAMPTFKKV